MVLNEKHNEQNRQKWLSRAKRERLDLSLSVEEALEDPTANEMSWEEELEEPASVSQRSPSKGVFPPRLSLQSRPVPALRPERTDETTGGSRDTLSPEPEAKLTPTANTNVLKRFAQRLTSSFAAFGSIPQPEIVESSLQPLQRERSQRLALSGPAVIEESAREVSADEAGLRQQTTPQRSASFPEGREESAERQGKQRLAGRTTRIHLETPPLAARSRQPGMLPGERVGADTAQSTNMSGVSEAALYSEKDAPGLPGVPLRVPGGVSEIASVSNASVPTVRQKTAETNVTGARLTAVDPAVGRGSGAPRRALSGSGVFEVGQGEATVVNRHVTESSVVLVTLTANPGPVVIQYVTLRPRIGFTVHLTAPATMRAPFNYLVLLGELF